MKLSKIEDFNLKKNINGKIHAASVVFINKAKQKSKFHHFGSDCNHSEIGGGKTAVR